MHWQVKTMEAEGDKVQMTLQDIVSVLLILYFNAQSKVAYITVVYRIL